MTKCRERILRKWANQDYTVYSWLTSTGLCPAIQPGRTVASKSEVYRLLEQGAVTIDGRKVKPWHVMPLEPREVVFFKGAKRQCSVW